MTSRDGSEAFMPPWPMAMPSVTVMVQNSPGASGTFVSQVVSAATTLTAPGLYLAQNVNKARVQGVEASWRATVWGTDLGANVTFQNPLDETNNTQLLRRARKDRLRQPVLAAEVVVQERRVDPCLLRDLLRPRTGRAAAQEHAVRRVEEALFRCGVRRGHRPGSSRASTDRASRLTV
mgnify:CR=1 FL=1